MKPKIYTLVLCTCLLFFTQADVTGQELKRFEQIISQGTSLHIFADQGEATIQVLVLGSRSPGVYEIGSDVRLDQLLFLSGGTDYGKRFKVDIRVYREEVMDRRLIYESKIKEMLEKPSLYPDLRSGDVLVVEVNEKSKFDWRDTVRIVTSITSIIGLVRLFRGDK